MDVLGEDYVLKSDFTKFATKVDMFHRVCGYTWSTLPRNLLIGHGCAKCAGNSKKSHEDFKKEVEELVGDEYLLLSEYKRSKEKVKILHTKCGTSYFTAPNDFLAGKRCMECSGNRKKNTDQYAAEIDELTDGEYELVGEYKSARKKVLMLHKACGNTFQVRATSFTGSGSRCPKCNQSKGEKEIEKFLTANGFAFKKQHTFEDCVDIRMLKFDFAIFKEKRVVHLIEYDGRQHFEPVIAWGGEEAFQNTKRRDAIKNSYCIENGISLLRIPHWEQQNIADILKEELL